MRGAHQHGALSMDTLYARSGGGPDQDGGQVLQSYIVVMQDPTPIRLVTIAFHFGVVAEALRSDIQQIAEGHSVIRHEIQEMRNDFRDEFKEMRALMRLSFAQLDQWIGSLEAELSSLKSRVDRLEASQT